MVKSVNVRLLKDKLSSFLREVQRGVVVLVTDRGKVVAELRRPSSGTAPLDTGDRREQALADEGVLSLGLPHDPELYNHTPETNLDPRTVQEALDWARGEK